LERSKHIRDRVKRVGVIGDVHTEADALQLALGHFAGMRLDRVVCTGDVPDGPLDARSVARCCELLQQHGVLTVSGNHDRWLQDGEMRDIVDATDPTELPTGVLRFLAALAPIAELDSVVGPVLVCHGMGADDMSGVQPFDHGLALDENRALAAVLAERRYRIVINGHTHRPMVRTLGELTIINAGTLLRQHGSCCSVVDFDQRSVQFFSVGSERVTESGGALTF
jgi:predicted phosphodiesterase